jgi:uncharacterized protein with ParB-like and HNH nuclease domain
MSAHEESQLDYKPLQVVKLFDSEQFYSVPAYQRGYSWTKDEISELLEDLDDAFSNYPDEEYLLGQIIVCPSQESSNPEIKLLPDDLKSWDLIDGQQRTTTLFILIARSLLKITEFLKSEELQLSKAESKRFSEWESCTSVIDNSDLLIPRIRAAASGHAILQALIDNSQLPEPIDGTQENLRNAISIIDDSLDQYEPRELYLFLKFVLSKVWIVRLGLKHHQHALRVFQKVNNRGLQLDDSDLIKSHLFHSAKSEEAYKKLSGEWDAAGKKVFEAKNKRLKSMETLTKFLIGIRTGRSISKGALYDTWILELSDEIESGRERARESNYEKVLAFANSLPIEASNLVSVSKGIVPASGVQTDYIQGTLDAGWIQPLEVLLAGSHLSEESFKNLQKLVEDRTMLSFWAKEKNNTFEALIHPWAHAVKNLDSYATFDDIRDASKLASEGFSDLASRAFIGITSLNYDVKSHRPRIRYVLARTHQAFQKQIDVTQLPISELMKTPKDDEPGYHIDHVFPKSLGKRESWKQNPKLNENLGNSDRSEAKIHSIGNLILLHPLDNWSQSDALPDSKEKLANLGASEFYLNRLLVPSEMWSRNKHPRTTEILDKYQARRAIILDSDITSEEKIDNFALLNWDILIQDIKANFGIK